VNRLARRVTLRREGSDDGSALVMTIIIGMVLLTLVATATLVAVSGTRKSSHDADWNAAIAAAYAGVEDYKSRLSNDNTYVRYGNPASTFGAGGPRTLPAAGTNPAFGLGTSGTWASVPGSVDGAQFRYEVDNSTYSATGSLRLRSTGRVGNQVRSIVVNLKQEGFVDYLYFTDYEMIDPAQLADPSNCTPVHAWKRSTGTHPSGCSRITFAADDAINGPLHSNDTIYTCGATKFKGEFTTSNPTSPFYKETTSSCADPVFTVAPKTAINIGMPPTNSEMLSETRTDLDSVTRPGCLYTGPTTITFTADGKMNVKSPFTRKTRIVGSPAIDGSTPPECGLTGDVTNGLGSEAGATIPVIAQNLVYVQTVPTVSNNPNYWASNRNPAKFTCSSASTWTFGTLTFPAAGEYVRSASPAHYGCRNGDIYVKGVLDGQVTLASENYIYVTGDITYEDKSEDILGLVGQNAVWVMKPAKCTKWEQWDGRTYCASVANLNGTGGRTIEAAILSVQHTFIVQNYDVGARMGTLTVTGAIAQKFRGPVATGSDTGYAKSYSYDSRLKYMAPPKFLSPVSTTYGVSEIVEVKTAFKPDGSAAT
jgi:Tfp pilus assembly protein PilX